jgi:hypothetical protein
VQEFIGGLTAGGIEQILAGNFQLLIDGGANVG